MPTNNDDIIDRYLKHFDFREEWLHDYNQSFLNKETINAELIETITNKHIGAIWNWWTTKPQKSKNDATTKIITRADIEDLVKLIDR